MQDHHEPSSRETLLTLLGSALALAVLALAGNAVPDVLLGLIRL